MALPAKLHIPDGDSGRWGWGLRLSPEVVLRPGRLTLQHASVGCVSNGVDVGWHLVPLLALVHVHDLF